MDFGSLVNLITDQRNFFIQISALTYYAVAIVICQIQCSQVDHASEHLSEVLKGHDTRIRPYINEKAVEVTMQVSVVDFGPVHEKDFTFRADMYIRYWWKDPRLNLQNVTDVNFIGCGDVLWIPDVFITNSLQIMMFHSTTQTIRCAIRNKNNVYLSARITSVCSCQMNLRSYPFDTQSCFMNFESYSFNSSDLSLVWHNSSVEYDDDEIQIDGYELTKIESLKSYKYFISGERFDRLRLSFHLKRTLYFYLVRSYIPSSVLVIMTWGAFWLPMTTYPARIGLIVTNFLASVFILQGEGFQITKVPYSTALEFFLIGNVSFILAALVEYIIVVQLSRQQALKMNEVRDSEQNSTYDWNDWDDRVIEKSYKVHHLDKMSRTLFPAAYCIFIVVYFSLYIK